MRHPSVKATFGIFPTQKNETCGTVGKNFLLFKSHSFGLQRRYEVARQKRNVMDKSHVVGLGQAVARSDAEGGAAHPTYPAAKRAAG